MKADLHVHGPISFSNYWLKKQGYLGKNILQLMTDRCVERGIDICAITSDYWDIPKSLGKIPKRSRHDRFNWLKDDVGSLPKNYKFGELGENTFVVEKDNKQVYFVNGQTVHAFEDGREIDSLVVGTNQVPFRKSIEETAKWGRGEIPIIHGAEHPITIKHRGMGEKLLKKNIQFYDFVEGFNSQMIHYSWIPILNRFPKKANEDSQKIAEEDGTPWIATTDADRIKDIGISYIESNEPINLQNDESIILGLKQIIETKTFKNVWDYEPLLGWFDFVSKCQIGILLRKGD